MHVCAGMAGWCGLSRIYLGVKLHAGIAGYVSASYYRQFEGHKWVTNLLLTCSVFCGPLLAMFAINNTVAIVYGVSGLG